VHEPAVVVAPDPVGQHPSSTEPRSDYLISTLSPTYTDVHALVRIAVE
jgi:hypothetical protein